MITRMVTIATVAVALIAALAPATYLAPDLRSFAWGLAGGLAVASIVSWVVTKGTR